MDELADAPLRVMHVIGGLGVGGAERMLERLVLAQRAQGLAEAIVVSLTDEGVIGARLRAQGIEVQTLHMFGGARGMVTLPLVVARLARRMRAWRPDIVQTWLYHADMIGGAAALSAGHGKLVWGIHCTDPGPKAATRMVARLCAWGSHRLPDSIVCCGHEPMRAHGDIGYDRGRMTVLHNGFDVSHFTPRAGAAHQGVRFVAIGRADPIKDYPTLLRAAALVVRHVPDAHFVIVGRAVPQQAAYRALIAELGLQDRVDLRDQVEDVRSILAESDVLCLSSLHEGLPNVIGEAMLMEVPCVVTDTGDCALMVGDTGEVAPVGDPQGLADAMMRVALLSPAERARRGRAARRRIVQHFEIGQIAKAYAAHYRAMFAKRA